MQKTILTPAQPQAQPPFLAVVLQFYALALKLYPSDFRLAFADEMCDVFAMHVRNTRGTIGLCTLLIREAAGLPVAVWQVRRQTFAQQPALVQRRFHIHLIVRLAGALLGGFLLMTLDAIFSPSYQLYAAAVPFAVALLVATISLLLGVFWGRIGGILTLCSGTLMGCCMILYAYLMGVEQLGVVSVVLIGLIWALPFLIFGILFYELSKPPKQNIIPA